MVSVMDRLFLIFLALCGLLVSNSCFAQETQPSPYLWTKFVHVEGQPGLVPAEWVATPEGKFAQSIKIPNPVPKDSGYRKGMTSEQYFEHLCKTEAGEFIYKTVDNVEGFYFMRPPNRPTDDELMDRYKLEAPDIERIFQALRPTTEYRAILFISPPWRLYKFIEEPTYQGIGDTTTARASGYQVNVSPMRIESVDRPISKYGLIWRGIKRPHDRELAIAGSEWIVINLITNEVLAVRRNYGRTGFNRNSKEGIWWLNAITCPNLSKPRTLVEVVDQIYKFSSKVIRPVQGIQNEQ